MSNKHRSEKLDNLISKEVEVQLKDGDIVRGRLIFSDGVSTGYLPNRYVVIPPTSSKPSISFRKSFVRRIKEL